MLSRRIFCSAVLAIACLVCLSHPAAADDTSNLLLEGVRWAGPAVTLDGLKGKTVVVSLCDMVPDLQQLVARLVQQLKAAVADRPVVVLAIDTDEEPRDFLKYMNDHGFYAPNIVHGYDHSIAKRAGLPDLWGYAIIGPSGKLLSKGHAGTYRDEGGEKKFTLPEDIARSENLGEFVAIEPKMNDAVKQALWPFELGITAGPASGAEEDAPPEQRELDAAMSKYLSKELDRIRELAKGELDDQFSAYDRAAALAARFKSASQTKDAQKLAASLVGDAKFKRELAAKRAYEKCAQSSADAKRKATAMKTLAKRFAGTEYGEKAKTAGDEGG